MSANPVGTDSACRTGLRGTRVRPMSPEAFFQWRRRLLISAGCAAVAPAFAAPSASAPSDHLKGLLAERRSIWLVRGKEQLEATYWSAERGYDREQYLQLCWALRDMQAGRVFPMDHGLLDVLAGLQAWLSRSGVRAPLEIHSGYRTRATNQKLEGAALSSTPSARQGRRCHRAGREERPARRHGERAGPRRDGLLSRAELRPHRHGRRAHLDHPAKGWLIARGSFANHASTPSSRA